MAKLRQKETMTDEQGNDVYSWPCDDHYDTHQFQQTKGEDAMYHYNAMTGEIIELSARQAEKVLKGICPLCPEQ